MADQTKNWPECAKQGRTVAMKEDKRHRPAGDSKVESMFMGEDVWVCPECGYAEAATA